MRPGDKESAAIELCGDDLLTVAVADPQAAQALADELRRNSEWLEVVPGIDSVVLQFDAALTTPTAAREAILVVFEEGIPPVEESSVCIEIPVVYGGEFGPDFSELCKQTGLSAAEFIELHTGGDYRVDLVGFTPGFVYVGGLDERLRVPRRPNPRQSIPAGSVGIADGRTGLYAMSGPGGWPLIGCTNYTLFDPDATDPFPIRPGMRIRFVEESRES